jgi:UDP-N-acetylmuramoyl-L-alanine---L-glutamate ligase
VAAVIAVVGLGAETRQLLQVLDAEHRGDVLLVDERGSLDDLPTCPNLTIATRTGIDLDDPAALPEAIVEVYRSPGVSPYRPALRALLARGIPITTPTGRWARSRDGSDTIAITGTKGKSTTASLTAHLLAATGRRTALLGNVGQPALALDPRPEVDDVVLELSSYQLVDLEASFAVVGVTTLLRDHIPWHTSLERYHTDKLRLLAMGQRRICSPQPAEVLASAGRGHDVDAVSCPPTPEVRAATLAAGLRGEHFAQDAMLALALVDARLCRAVGIPELIDAIASFRPLPHRLTHLGHHRGLGWVDDSISTVPESAVAAVAAYRDAGPVTLILGGDDRDQDLAPLVRVLADPQVRAVLLPPLASRLEPALGAVARDRIASADDLEHAVRLALQLTPVGGTVMLSPAASSFSAYRDFAARGDHFVALVSELGPPDRRPSSATDYRRRLS